jgi:Carboxypeptidase regulatory-like domain/TonB dependent receptor
MLNRISLIGVTCLVLSFGVRMASGQAITGTITGSVLDTSGAAVAGANVTVTNTDTGITYRTTSGTAGFYNVSFLPPGRYNVTAESKGFKTVVSAGNLIDAGTTTRVDFTLNAGSVNETVEVTSAPPVVESTESEIGTTIDSKQVNDLPFNGRLSQMAIFLLPGTVPQAWGDQDENPAASGSTLGGGPGNGTYASVNGFFFAGNNFMIDGVHNNEPANDYLVINTPFADIQEMRIDTSNPRAEFGTFGGAVYNLTTRSGTNQFHGQLFEYVRNDAFNAQGPSSFVSVKAPYHANQFGGAFGGPIFKNKLFFFGDFQYLTQHSGATYDLTVPSAAMRSGDLSELDSGGAGPITNPSACATIAAANAAAAATTGATPPPGPFTNCTASSAISVAGTYDTVPAGDISPIAAGFLSTNIIPAPTVGTGYAVNNAIFNAVNTESVPQFDARVDYAYSDHDRFFARESYLHRKFGSPAPGTEFMIGNNPNATNNNHDAVLAWDHIFSGTMVNEFRFGFNRYVTDDFVDSYGINENNTLGIPNGNLPGVAATSGIAWLNFQNFTLGNGSGQVTGDPGPIPNGLGRLANIYEFSENLTKTLGRQTLKVGTDIQHIQGGVANPQNDPRGCFNFNGNYTGNSALGPSGVTIPSGAAFADFLVGAPGGGACPGGGAMERDLFIDLPHVRFNFLGFYGQDDIRINQQFTLNLGLRWDVYTAPVSINNTQSNFVTSGPNAGLIQLATSSNRSPNVNTAYANFGPRIGFAYTPDSGKSVLRGGFGISYFPDNFGADSGTLERNYPELIQDNFLIFNEPSNGCTLTATGEYTSCGSLILANGLPGNTTTSPNAAVYSPLVIPSSTGGTPCLTGIGTTVTLPAGFVCPPAGSAVFEIEKNFKPDQAYAWNLSVQRALTNDMSFQVAYVGNRGYNLFHNYQLNQCDPPEIALAPGTSSSPFTNYPTCLPFPAIVPPGPPNAGSLILSAVNARNSQGESRYNALQAELQKRTSIGLTLQASYTFSKLLDNVDNPIDPYDTSLQLVGEGWKNGNYPQNFTVSYVYDLPFGKGRKYVNNGSGALGPVVSGWQVSGITTFRSGGALLINGNGSLMPPGADMETANYICQGSPTNNPHTRAEWFDTGCFVQPAVGTIGSARTGDAYGPGFQEWDFSVNKATAITEGKDIRFEANFFNIFNNTNLNNPNTTVGPANFGQITGYNGNPRQIQLGLKFLF